MKLLLFEELRFQTGEPAALSTSTFIFAFPWNNSNLRDKVYVNKSLSLSNFVDFNIMQSFSKSTGWSCSSRHYTNGIFGIIFTAFIALAACLSISDILLFQKLFVYFEKELCVLSSGDLWMNYRITLGWR